jgi:DNA invertase Pin-like site-specific DNA recombinase
MGISGWTGDNYTKGALGAFVQAVEDKTIPRGSVLICESLDRLSRQQIEEALEIFLKIIRLGIVIVTLEDGELEFRKGQLDLTKLVIAIAIMSRGHNESTVKSTRNLERWGAKREQARQGKRFSKGACPGWLKWDGKEYSPKPKARETLELIFRRTVEGLGEHQLLAELVKQKRPSFTGRSWCRSTLQNVIKDRAVYGEWHPIKGDPIPNFYPALIPEQLYLRAQGARKQRTGKRGASDGGWVNLFTGLVFNAKDKQSMLTMTVTPKGKEQSRRLVSYGHTKKEPGADPVSVNYDQFEAGILDFLREIKVSDIIPQTPADDTLPAKRQELLGIESRLSQLQTLLETAGNLDTLVKAIGNLEVKRERVRRELMELQHQQAVSQAAPFKEAQSIVDLFGKTTGEELKNLRLKLRAALAATVDKIWVQPIKERGSISALLTINFRSGASRQVFRRKSKTYLLMNWKNVTFDGGMVLKGKHLEEFLKQHP